MIKSNRTCIQCGHKWECIPFEYCKLRSKENTKKAFSSERGCRSLCISCLIKEDELKSTIYEKLQSTNCYKKEDKAYLVACLL
jgi:hypothetical protein